MTYRTNECLRENGGNPTGESGGTTRAANSRTQRARYRDTKAHTRGRRAIHVHSNFSQNLTAWCFGRSGETDPANCAGGDILQRKETTCAKTISPSESYTWALQEKMATSKENASTSQNVLTCTREPKNKRHASDPALNAKQSTDQDELTLRPCCAGRGAVRPADRKRSN